MRKLLIGLPLVLAFAIVAVPAGQPPTILGTAQPETDGVGWDQVPAAGGWGGRGADGTFGVAWEAGGPDFPGNIGRWAEVTIPGQRGKVPVAIDIEYLAGIANDDFCVLVEKWKSSSPNSPKIYVAVGCVDEDEIFVNEDWTSATIDLPRNVFHPGQDVTVQIRVTGNAWSGQGTYGQVAIDSITVWAKNGHGN